MSKSAFLTARIEPKLKVRASRVLAKVGVSTTDAITMFLRQVVLRGGLPFDVRVPTYATGKAIEELEAGRGEILSGRTNEIFDGVVRPRKKRKHENPPVELSLHDIPQTRSGRRNGSRGAVAPGVARGKLEFFRAAGAANKGGPVALR